jgi:hypothetical protein
MLASVPIQIDTPLVQELPCLILTCTFKQLVLHGGTSLHGLVLPAMWLSMES